jgi:hypothetical protein
VFDQYKPSEPGPVKRILTAAASLLQRKPKPKRDDWKKSIVKK